MYATLKNIAKWVIPQGLLTRYELPLRRLYANVFYRGQTHDCNICESHFSHFIKLPKGDLLCPVCGSLPRNRRLWFLLQQKQRLSGSVLHFSPSRVLYRKLKQQTSIEYVSTDFEEEFIADHRIDITKIDYPPDRFDTIICFHILEHIIEDQKAMRELHRVLKPGGTALIQTPFKEGEIYEDERITTEDERLLHFGQKDHVRVYSAEGLQERLESKGFQVELLRFPEDDLSYKYGLKKGEIILLANKN